MAPPMKGHSCPQCGAAVRSLDDKTGRVVCAYAPHGHVARPRFEARIAYLEREVKRLTMERDEWKRLNDEAVVNVHVMQEDRAERQTRTVALVEALRNLANEVGGLHAMELEVREAISNTNWSVLQLRRKEAELALAAEANTKEE